MHHDCQPILGNRGKTATDHLLALKILEEVQGAVDVEEICHVCPPSNSYFLRVSFSAPLFPICALAHIMEMHRQSWIGDNQCPLMFPICGPKDDEKNNISSTENPWTASIFAPLSSANVESTSTALKSEKIEKNRPNGVFPWENDIC